MTVVNTIDSFCNTGIKSGYNAWEIQLTRKLNLLSLIGVFNVSITLVFFLFMGLHEFVMECLFTLAVAPFVIVLNVKRNYIWSAYLFYLIGVVLFFVITLKMGIDSLVILFYFPILISLVQIFGRKETLRHMFIISFLFFVSIVVLTVGYQDHYLRIEFTESTLMKLKVFNIISSFFLTVCLILIFTTEHIKQEAIIKNMLREKETLLAEVFHRVKNNMNIINSLLNLKKHASQSAEVKQALEECRERVFSMALVHQKIYSNNDINSLNFNEYVHELVNESVNSIGGKQKVDVEIRTGEVELSLDNAIPCGLILNELITNSFKHAEVPGKKLKIEVCLGAIQDEITLQFKDNGPGFSFDRISKDSLGMELIQSLAGQLNAKWNVSNQNGNMFELSFCKN